MTIREAFSEIQALLQNFCPENAYPVAARHLKHAALEFSRTPATIQTITVPMTGAANYTLRTSRIGRIYHVEHTTSSRLYAPRLVEIAELNEQYPDPSTTGDEARYLSIFGRTLRVAPLVSSGTITLYVSPAPVMRLRDTPRNENETATAGSTTTAVASTITQGIVNNRGGETDFFNDCRIVFTSGTTLSSQASFITKADEGTSAITFTFSPAVSLAVTTETFQIEDVVEVPEQYLPGCISYAAGMIAALDSKAGPVASRLLEQWDAVINEAKGKPFGWQPGSKHRIADYMERAGNLRWVS